MTLSKKTKHVIVSLNKDLQNSVIDCFHEENQNTETDHYPPNIWSYKNMALSREFNDQKQPSKVFLKTNVSKDLAKFTGKHWCWSLFLISFSLHFFLLKRDSKTGVFCEIYEIHFKNIFIYRAPLMAASE